MPTYRHPSGKRFLFIHIPRTGGRFIETNLELNNWELEPIDYRGISHGNWALIDDCEVAHFHKPLHEKYCDIKNIPHIVVVRDPIERFISASLYLRRGFEDDAQSLMEDNFDETLETFRKMVPESENWFRSQVDFLTDESHIWKFEDGLGKLFGKFMSEILGLPFKVDAFAEYTVNKDEWFYKLDKTDKLIDNVRQHYRRDYEHLYPELDSSLQEGEKTKT